MITVTSVNVCWYAPTSATPTCSDQACVNAPSRCQSGMSEYGVAAPVPPETPPHYLGPHYTAWQR
eukprot:977465-Amphidinium_carterae.1